MIQPPRHKEPLRFILPIINIDKPNGFGTIYTKEAVDKMLIDFNAKKNALGFNGVYGGKTENIDGDRYSIDLSEITHVTENLEVYGNTVYVNVNFMDNQEGKFCADLIRTGKYLIRPTIKGTLSEKREVEFVNIISFDMLPWNDGFSTRAEDIEWIKIK